MTRYYSEQWQNAATRQGKRSPFGGKDSQHAVTDPVELQGIIAEWLDQATGKLKEHLKEPLSWQEGMLAPYHVGELGVPVMAASFCSPPIRTTPTCRARSHR